MGKILMSGTSGGVTSDDITAKREDIIAGKTAITADSDDEIVEGTLPDHTDMKDCLRSGVSGNYHWQDFPRGAYRRTDLPNEAGGRVQITLPNLRTDIGYTNPAKVLNDTTIAGQTGTIPIQGGSTIVPGTGNKTAIGGGRYASGNIIVSGDPNLAAGNIRSGVTIFGVRGNVEEYKTPSVITDYSGTITARDSSQSGRDHWVSNNNSGGPYMAIYQGAWAIGRLSIGLNLTGWNYIDFYASATNAISEAYYGISQNANLSSFSFTNTIKFSGGANQQVKMNVSANSGVWYFYIGINHTGAGTGRTNGAVAMNIKLMTQ